MKNSLKICLALLILATVFLVIDQPVSAGTPGSTVAALDGPVILGPPSGTVTTDHTPNFAWNTVPGATAYIIQVSPREDFSIRPINHTVAGGFFAPGIAMINQPYWWRVTAIVDGALTEWSEVRTITITGAPGNAAPVAVGPEDGFITTDRTPTFDWTDVPTAVRYRIQMSTLPGFGVWLVNQTTTASEFTPGVNLNPGTYYWRVQAEGGGDSSWFSVRRQIIIQLPEANLPAPALLMPAASAVVYPSQPQLTWETVFSATKYVVEVTDPDDVVLGTWEKQASGCDVDSCALTLPANLGSDYGEYDWKVKAQNDTQDGDWSTTRSFVYTQPGVVTLLSPESMSTTGDSTPVMSWTMVEGAATYNLHVMYAANSATLVQDQIPVANCDVVDNTCTAVPSAQMTDGEWKWQVRAENGLNYGPWSSVWYVTTDTTAGTEYEFDFEDTLDPEDPEDFDPYWIDADDDGNWYVLNGRYRGTEGAVEGFYHSTVFFNHSFGDGIFEAMLRSGGDDADLGFSIIFHGSFDGSNDLDDGYVVKILEDSEGITARFWRVENGFEVESLGEVSWSGDGSGEYPMPSEWHIYRLELFGNTMTFSIDGEELHTLANLNPALNTGMFGLDVESSTLHNLYMEIEEIIMTDMETP
ncbi:MAG: fibronectin type III domain-containing protein [Anaerolineae bacterium]|nr:fibronectin type III domain-containing protein [Anaerolineae bacterium]